MSKNIEENRIQQKIQQMGNLPERFTYNARKEDKNKYEEILKGSKQKNYVKHYDWMENVEGLTDGSCKLYDYIRNIIWVDLTKGGSIKDMNKIDTTKLNYDESIKTDKNKLLGFKCEISNNDLLKRIRKTTTAKTIASNLELLKSKGFIDYEYKVSINENGKSIIQIVNEVKKNSKVLCRLIWLTIDAEEITKEELLGILRYEEINKQENEAWKGYLDIREKRVGIEKGKGKEEEQGEKNEVKQDEVKQDEVKQNNAEQNNAEQKEIDLDNMLW